MSGDGRLIGYSNYLHGKEVGYVLPTSAPSGPDDSHSRIVVRGPADTALSPDGQLMYAFTGSTGQVLAAYDVATGQLVRVLHRWPALAPLRRPVIDPAGGHLLVPIEKIPGHRKVWPWSQRFEHRCSPVLIHKVLKCDLSTGAVTSLPISEPGPGGWSIVAW